MLIRHVFIENPFVNSPIISNGQTNISGCALHVHMCHVVLEIPNVIKSQYNVTRNNKEGPFILFVNKVGSHKMHFIGFHRTYNFVQIPHNLK